MNFCKKIFSKNEQSAHKSILLLFVLHSLIMLFIIIAIILKGYDYTSYVLSDDGYFEMAKKIAHGNFIKSGSLPPLLPLLLSPIHFFPEFLHPFLRMIFSQFFVYLLFFTMYKLTKKYINCKQFLVGGILLIINPTFIQWTFKLTPDLYLSVFLGFFIFFIQKHFTNRKKRHLLIALLSFAMGIFVRPSFVFIPIFLVLFSLFYFKSRNKVIVSNILLLFTIVFYFSYSTFISFNKIGQVNLNPNAGRENVMINNFVLTQIILETKEFHKGTIDNYDINSNNNNDFMDGDEYLKDRRKTEIEKYWRSHPNGNTLHQVYLYSIENPKVLIAKILLGPIFFFSLSSREILSYFLLFISLLYFIMSIYGIKIIFERLKKDSNTVVYFLILFGYFFLHWVTHSYSRYSFVIIPFLFIWAGIPLEKFLTKIISKIQRKYCHK
jgi:hypothetical protein